MPIQFEILEDLRLRLATASGALEDEGFVKTFESYWRSPQYDKTLNVLYDFRRLSKFEVYTSTVQDLAELSLTVHRDPTGVKTAVVAPVDVVYGVIRMYQAFVDRSPNSFAVFREMADALEWLEVPEDRWVDFAGQNSVEVPPQRRSPTPSLAGADTHAEQRGADEHGEVGVEGHGPRLLAAGRWGQCLMAGDGVRGWGGGVGTDEIKGDKVADQREGSSPSHPGA